ncbi:hypothetical protein ACFQ1M_05745 [Sungkyunkwania multivorans]|uniref:Uncharacterized protein n=1 Tax=Sungkyunkwania multivorans TaxID=1173618 RepID=A0ABW3CW01_9FLAO
MSSIIKHISIPKDVATKDDLDYDFLRSTGISYIEQLGGKLWTDYNSHDPGITMLEMLCYAITDLGMRIDLPTEDLLAPEIGVLQDQFYKAADIFPSKPVNELDYRKLFIDIDGVKNCWLRKHEQKVWVNCKDHEQSYNKSDFEGKVLGQFIKSYSYNGLYDLFVEYDEFEEGLTEAAIIVEKDRINKDIRASFHRNRNLCEDLEDITDVQTQGVSVCAEIEVAPEADEELIDAKIKYAIEQYFSPSLQFYSISQMLDKGYTTDQIFDGPILVNGFIDTEELKAAELRREVRLSDIMKLIMNIEGVLLIRDIAIGFCDTDIPVPNKWLICIDPDKKPVLCKTSKLSYAKGVLPLNLNEEKSKEYLRQLKEDAKQAQSLAKSDLTLQVPSGSFTASENYLTIQNDFPDVYGIGQEGLSSRSSTARKAQAKQLKGYLLFFDKVLATYFKHLSKVKDLLSVTGVETKTYFTQAVKGIKGFDDLVAYYPKEDDEALTELLFDQFDNNIERRNELLDHLLARFAEYFGEYSFLMKTLYGDASEEIVLQNKEKFLEDYRELSRSRGHGFNYKAPLIDMWDTDNISGWQRRIARLIGMKNYHRRNLSNSFIDIYELVNSDGEDVFRWRIHNANGKIMLSGTEEYTSVDAAETELNFAALQVIQTSERAIEEQLMEGLSGETTIKNIHLHQADSGRWSFDVINPLADPDTKDYIIAKQFVYYDTLEEVKDAILELIHFMKFEFTEEGIFLVEHILLRPDNVPYTGAETLLKRFLPICDENCNGDIPLDLYSYMVSIVLPGYTFRFQDFDFRNYLEDLIRKELPAHVLAKICWVGERKGSVPDDQNDLLCFEKAYKAFLEQKSQEDEQPKAALSNLIDAMSKLNSIYPTGRLLDCDDESDSLKGKMILGQTNLGNNNTKNTEQ